MPHPPGPTTFHGLPRKKPTAISSGWKNFTDEVRTAIAMIASTMLVVSITPQGLVNEILVKLYHEN
jgi:hypothetical protein